MLHSFIVAVMLAISASAEGQAPVSTAQQRANAPVNAQQPVNINVQQPADAQQPVRALTTCLADSTSGRERKDLAKWVFFAIAAHPEIKQFTSANIATSADESSRTVASLVLRLLTESCLNETRAALKSQAGGQALELAFQELGMLAMQELMTDKSVQASMAAFGRYVDQKRLYGALAGK